MAERPAPVKLTGVVHSHDYFRFVARDGIDWDVWSDVLKGKVVGARFRGVLDEEACEQIARKFWGSPVLQRPHDAKKGYRYGPDFVGASSLDGYLEEAERARPHIDAMLDVPGHRSLPSLCEEYRAYLAEQGVAFRLAAHEGRRAGAFKLRARTATGGTESFALVPHDDAEAIRRTPHLKGFEIQRAGHICGVVACVENGPGGELLCWNVYPDRESRRALGFDYDSHGYPAESLAAFQRITVPVRPGDINVFDMGIVHAVGWPGPEGSHRCTVQWGMAYLDATTVLQWS
jgi:hypothetical protein